MYNFNYFSPYIKPKSKRGYYLGVLAASFILVLGILIAFTVFMKMRIKEKENQVVALTSQISEPALAQEIKRGIEFRERIREVNLDKDACEKLDLAIPYMNSISKDKILELNRLLTEDMQVLSLSCSQGSIEMNMSARYDKFISVAQLLEAIRKSDKFDYAVVPNINDPYGYGSPHSAEYVVFPLYITQNGGEIR